MTIKSLQIERSESRRHVLFVVVLIAIELFAVIETAMAFAAMPTFMRVFEADATAVGWTSTAYLLVAPALPPPPVVSAISSGDRRY